jgi:hypothetical protein
MVGTCRLRRAQLLLGKLAAALALSLICLAGSGCSKGAGPCVAPSGTPATTTLPRLEQTCSIATHNSYWVNRAVRGDLSASGVEERFVDQILDDHARGLELDIHKDPNAFGSFAVFHTHPGNSLCDTLAQRLGLLRAIDYVMGSWDNIGAISTADSATYALHGAVTDRAAFSMASSWKHVRSA